MKSYGFNIVAMWKAKTSLRTEFVYLLEWPDEQPMQDAWARKCSLSSGNCFGIAGSKANIEPNEL